MGKFLLRIGTLAVVVALLVGPFSSFPRRATWQFWVAGVVLGLVIGLIRAAGKDPGPIALSGLLIALAAFVAAILYFVRSPASVGAAHIFIAFACIFGFYFSAWVSRMRFLSRGAPFTMTHSCPHCGQEAPAEDRVCARCGARV
jgi:hypothetical protein